MKWDTSEPHIDSEPFINNFWGWHSRKLIWWAWSWRSWHLQLWGDFISHKSVYIYYGNCTLWTPKDINTHRCTGAICNIYSIKWRTLTSFLRADQSIKLLSIPSSLPPFPTLSLADQTIQDAPAQFILNTVILELQQNPNRTFIYVEITFFIRWWNEQSDATKEIVSSDWLASFTGHSHIYLAAVSVIVVR